MSIYQKDSRKSRKIVNHTSSMKELFSDVKAELPRFFINFIGILTSPSTVIVSLAQSTHLNNEARLRKASLYYLLSAFLTIVWQLPMYGKAELLDKSNYALYSFIIPFLFVALASVALKLSWKLLKKDMSYVDCFILMAYQFGTLLNFYLFTNFINLCLLRYNSIETFKHIVNEYFLNSSTTGSSFESFSNPAYLYYVLIGAFSLIGVLVWFYRGWRAYRSINQASNFQSNLAAVVFTVLMVLVFIIDMAIATFIKTL